MKKLFTTTLLAILFFAGITSANAQADLRKKEFNVSKSGVAIEGFDPVAYFTKAKAVKGSKDLAVSDQGIIYYFSTAQNKELFKANAAKYEPQYGGWCAYAMGATNEKVEVDPETFKIKDGKLYLFYHSWANNTLTKWNKDEVALKAKADLSWAKFYH